MEQPDVAGSGPVLRPDVPVEEQVRAAVAAARRRRRVAVAGGLAALVSAAVLLAVRNDPDPAPPVAPPVAAPSPAPAVPAVPSLEQVVEVAVGSDTVYALLGSCAGPEQARQCGYRLMAQTRGGPWSRLPLVLPPPAAGDGFRARLLLTGVDTLTVLDESHGRAYVSEGGAPFAVRRIRAGRPLSGPMPSGLVPELVRGRVAVLDPATGLRRPLAAQPRLGAEPRAVAVDPVGDLWALAEAGPRVVVGHSADGGRSWRAAAVPGLAAGLVTPWLVLGQDGAVHLIGVRAGRPGPEVWRLPAGGTWARVSGDGPRSVSSVVAGRSGLVLTDGSEGLWRLSPAGSFRRLPDPVVAGIPVRAGPLVAAGAGRVVSSPVGGIGGSLLLVSADDGDSWLPTLVPG